MSLASTENTKKDRFTDKFQHKSTSLEHHAFKSCESRVFMVFAGWHIALFQQNKHIITWTRDSICLHRHLFTEISYAQTSDEQQKIVKSQIDRERDKKQRELKRESYEKVNWIYILGNGVNICIA